MSRECTGEFSRAAMCLVSSVRQVAAEQEGTTSMSGSWHGGPCHSEVSFSYLSAGVMDEADNVARFPKLSSIAVSAVTNR